MAATPDEDEAGLREAAYTPAADRWLLSTADEVANDWRGVRKALMSSRDPGVRFDYFLRSRSVDELANRAQLLRARLRPQARLPARPNHPAKKIFILSCLSSFHVGAGEARDADIL